MKYITKGYIVGLHHPQEKRLKFCGHRETHGLWMQYAVGWCEGYRLPVRCERALEEILTQGSLIT